MKANTSRGRSVRFLTDYEDQANEETLEIPEDLTSLSDEDLGALSTRAQEAFAALYQGGQATLSEEDLTTLGALTEGIEALAAETTSRGAAAAQRAESAAALAARVNPPAEDQADTEDGEADDEENVDEADTEDGDDSEDEEDVDENEEEAVTAGGTRATRINLGGLRNRQRQRPADAPTERTMRDIVLAAPDVPGFSLGQGMDFTDLGKAVNTRLQTFPQKQYETAASRGKHIRQQFGVATIQKEFPKDLRIDSNDPDHVERVMAYAANESRLQGGSLVASGGWCAPSETVYDLFEMESRDGLFSVPEVQISRGGIKWTQGPDFSEIFALPDFCFTEEQDISGEDYPKECFHIDCPDFLEERLDFCGLCITAGLLQRRGYPEVIARTIRGALTAHAHKMSARKIEAIVSGSTAVSLPADQVGALAPTLTAIELQVEHYKDLHRMTRGTTLEAVFPFWIRGAIRSDLSRRLGVDLIDVTDARIDAWFRSRGVNPQFVYNWQSVSSTSASGFTAWPGEVDFLLYAAGTWVAGSSDIITLDTVYDSTLLGTNDYTALFTEEGWLMTKRGHDSRVVTVPLCPTGDTGGGVLIDCDGSAGA